MKHMLHTLYVLHPDSKLTLDNQAVLVTKSDGSRQRVVCNLIDSLYCFGNQSITLPLVRYCDEHGISLVYFDRHGQYVGRFQGRTHGSVYLRMAQYRMAEEHGEKSLHLVKGFLKGKLLNAREVLMRAAREAAPEQSPLLRAAADQQETHLGLIAELTDPDRIRAQEGLGANAYFEAFPHMIRNQSFSFHGRNRRPPKDPVNALLSYLYSLLVADTESALEAVGLDPACGMMHTLRFGRSSLALDMMEELRSALCDRLALTLLNRKQLSDKSFEREKDAVYLNDEGRKTVLKAWQSKKNEIITHPVLQEKIPIGLISFAQARLLAEFIRGDRTEYIPFLWK